MNIVYQKQNEHNHMMLAVTIALGLTFLLTLSKMPSMRFLIILGYDRLTGTCR